MPRHLFIFVQLLGGNRLKWRVNLCLYRLPRLSRRCICEGFIFVRPTKPKAKETGKATSEANSSREDIQCIGAMVALHLNLIFFWHLEGSYREENKIETTSGELWKRNLITVCFCEEDQGWTWLVPSKQSNAYWFDVESSCLTSKIKIQVSIIPSAIKMRMAFC